MSGTSSNDRGENRPRLRELSVPEDLYEDVIEFIAERRRAQRALAPPPAPAEDTAPADGSSVSEEAENDSDSQSEGSWDAESLRGLLDQANTRLVTALVVLARSEEPLPTETITAAAGLQPGRSWGGFISRAQASSRHRWGRDLPIHWYDWDGRNNYYRLDERDAAVIRRWADENGR